jgi:Zn-dependent peptidase ImmA (M78 family)
MADVDPRYEIVRRTQVAIFRESGVAPDDLKAAIGILDPRVVADYLGLNYCEVEEIPSGDWNYRTAGLLDVANKRIYISRAFPLEQQRLTAMHEIVHWFLHRNVVGGMLHRDRPVNHRPKENEVPLFEWEATHVACLALMPEKAVKNYFAEVYDPPFGQPLTLDETAAFRLGLDIEAARKLSMLDKAILLATASHYGRPVVPLCKFFKVSRTAMAIRLQELGLIAPDRPRGRPHLCIVR